VETRGRSVAVVLFVCVGGVRVGVYGLSIVPLSPLWDREAPPAEGRAAARRSSLDAAELCSSCQFLRSTRSQCTVT
jgi:hypothetical protein